MSGREVLLTFDLEEFDIPNEYGASLEWEEQLAVGRLGMQSVIEVLELENVPVTIFTTAAYALENVEQMQFLASKHEIGSHTFYHSAFNGDDLLQSKLTLQQITGKTIHGLRMPRMKQVDMSLVYAAGYAYDTSVNPTFIPGKYNNSHLPKVLYTEKQVHRIPCTVTPLLRIPLFWLAFKNFPYAFYKKLAVTSLHKYGYLNLYFHPWEFTDISNFRLPAYIKRNSGSVLTERLHRLINDLKQEGSFETMHRFLQNKLLPHNR